MVLYNLAVIPPGLSPDIVSGPLLDADVMTFVFGPDKVTFTIPVTHLRALEIVEQGSHSEFFDGSRTTIELSDKDPAAFALFVKWLYHGFADNTESEPGLLLWVSFYIILHQFRIAEPLPQIARRIWNLTVDKARDELTVWDGSQAHDRFAATVETAYEICADYDIRFIFVHALHQFNKMYLHPFVPLGLGPNQDLVRWTTVVSRTTGQGDGGDFRWESHIGCAESHMHRSDLILLPMLYADEPWPEYKSRWTASDVDERACWRGVAEMRNECFG